MLPCDDLWEVIAASITRSTSHSDQTMSRLGGVSVLKPYIGWVSMISNFRA